MSTLNEERKKATVSRFKTYTEVMEILDRNNLSPSEFSIMYNFECYLTNVDQNVKITILEQTLPYLYQEWLDRTGATIEEVVEDAIVNFKDLCKKINLTFSDEKSEELSQEEGSSIENEGDDYDEDYQK